MAASALLALLHDIAVTVGVFAILQVEVSPATVIGFLTILGYSLYDTVVVFDKVRELTSDVYEQKHYTFAEYVNLAVNQTMVRSINTSVVALLPVGAILIIGTAALGPGTLVDISLALFIGMIAGTYSSIFIASPLLVTFQELSNNTREHNAAVAHERAHRTTTGESSSAKAVKVAPIKPGKRLGKRVTEIAVIFKRSAHVPFGNSDLSESGQNALVIRVQPDEGLTLKLGAKVPGTSMQVRDVTMDFAYGHAFTEDSPEAYERLILVALLGRPPPLAAALRPDQDPPMTFVVFFLIEWVYSNPSRV